MCVPIQPLCNTDVTLGLSSLCTRHSEHQIRTYSGIIFLQLNKLNADMHLLNHLLNVSCWQQLISVHYCQVRVVTHCGGIL